MAKYCSKCGKELKEGAKFCASCGAAVKQTQFQKPPVTPGEVSGNSENQQGFTAQDMQYQQLAASGTTGVRQKNRWLLVIPAAIILLLAVIFGVKTIVSPAYLKPVKYLEKAINKQDIRAFQKAVPDEYASWVTEDMLEAVADGDSHFKVTLKVTDKEKIDRKNLEDVLTDDYYIPESIAEKAKAGYILSVEETLKQGDKKNTQEFTFVVAKVNGRWVIVSGL